ncbi:MAG: PKD domain-containing protein [Thermoplasmatota archaeon]
MKNNTKYYSILKTSLVLAIVISIAIPGVSSIGQKTTENNLKSEFLLTYNEFQQLKESYDALLLDVHDYDSKISCCTSTIEGSFPVALIDIICPDCLETRLKKYEILVIFSQNTEIRSLAAEILRDDNYIVYELLDAPLINIDLQSVGKSFVNEGYSSIQLSNTNARVDAYEREGRIKRIYGEAFSQGSSPIQSAESFITNNVNVLGVNAEDLNFSHVQPIMYEQDTQTYKFTGVYYNHYLDDIPVYNSRLIFLTRNEVGYPLVLVSSDIRDLQDFTFELNQDVLNHLHGVTSALQVAPTLNNFEEPELVIWAGIDDMIVEPALAYSFIADNGIPENENLPEKYLFITEAETGDILYQENMILFNDVYGNVQGKATQGKAADFCEDELPEPIRWARVNIGSTIAYTDTDGNFIISHSGSSPVTVESRLWGQWFRVFNFAGSDALLTITVTPPGPANFMHNDLNNNEYIRAEVNGYFQSNIVREFALKYNPSYPGLQQNEFPVNVNRVGGYCPGNAWYDYSSINFCSSGSGYPNTAWSTVIHHEYGHHLVNMGGSGQGEYGEGMSDTMGMLITDDPGIGYGFFGNCNEPLRTGDNTMQYPCSGGIHYCGQVLSGCIWDTRNELSISNPDTYLDIISNLAINSILLHTGTSIDPSITIDFLVLDDDNGNIYDGTPHYNEIAAGFGAHNMPAPPLDLISFSFPYGLPLTVSPDGGTTVRVVVEPLSGTPQPGTGMFYYNTGNEWQQTPMNQIEENVYDATFPATTYLTTISYYFSAKDNNGIFTYSPRGAPSETYSTVSAYYAENIFADDFETDKGWTVENCNSLTDGSWERGVPVGGGVRGDPPTDYDGSGKCYLTGNRPGDSDVDDGYTWLISPTFDLSAFDGAKISYAVWYTNNFGANPNNDYFRVHVSNDNGASWVLAHEIGPATPLPEAWYVYEVMIGDFVTLNDQIKVRFEASDLLGQGSVVEAGVDAVTVIGYSSQSQAPEKPEKPTGTTQGKSGVTYTYSTSTIEPNGNPVFYLWDWGDGTFSDWLGPYASGAQASALHMWEEDGTYSIRVKAKNNFDAESEWSDPLSVTMPLSYNNAFRQFFTRVQRYFPNAFPLLQKLLIN